MLIIFPFKTAFLKFLLERRTIWQKGANEVKRKSDKGATGKLWKDEEASFVSNLTLVFYRDLCCTHSLHCAFKHIFFCMFIYKECD